MQRRKELGRKIDSCSGKLHTFPFVPKNYIAHPQLARKNTLLEANFHGISCHTRLTPCHEVFQAERGCTSKWIYLSFPQHTMYVLASIKNIKQTYCINGKHLCRPYIPSIFIISLFLRVDIRYIILLSNIKTLHM